MTLSFAFINLCMLSFFNRFYSTLSPSPYHRTLKEFLGPCYVLFCVSLLFRGSSKSLLLQGGSLNPCCVYHMCLLNPLSFTCLAQFDPSRSFSFSCILLPLVSQVPFQVLFQPLEWIIIFPRHCFQWIISFQDIASRSKKTRHGKAFFVFLSLSLPPFGMLDSFYPLLAFGLLFILTFTMTKGRGFWNRRGTHNSLKSL